MATLSPTTLTQSEQRTILRATTRNIRDHASIEQLLVLANIESMNADVARKRVDGVAEQRGAALGHAKGGKRRVPFGRRSPQFIHMQLNASERLMKLNSIAIRQMQSLTTNAKLMQQLPDHD